VADQGLVTFIQQSLSKGYSRSDLEQILIKKGWKPEQLQEAFSQIQAAVPGVSTVEAQAADYVKKYRALGYKDAQIEKALTDQKVDAATIKKLLATGAKKPLLQNKKLVLGIGGVLILLIIAITAWTIFPLAECESETDCESGYGCDTDAGECYTTCRSDTQCVSGYSCIDGACQEAECTRDADCGSREECVDNECVEIVIEEVEGEVECTTDADCPEFSICEEENCVGVECVSDEDCGEGFACVDYACAESVSEIELEEETPEEEAEENYGIDTLNMTSLNSSAAVVEISTFNGGATNGTDITYACVLYDYNETAVDSDTGTVDIDANGTATAECTLDPSDIYDILATTSETNITIAAAVDYNDEVNETDEEDNIYTMTDTWATLDFGVAEAECTEDANCTSGVCSSGTCVECESDGDCGPGYGCVSSACVAAEDISCIANDECPTGYACALAGYCSEDTDSSETADVDEVAACDEDADCTIGYACETSSGECYTGCTYGEDSSECASGYACASDGTCAEDTDTDAIANVDEAECLSSDECEPGSSCGDEDADGDNECILCVDVDYFSSGDASGIDEDGNYVSFTQYCVDEDTLYYSKCTGVSPGGTLNYGEIGCSRLDSNAYCDSDLGACVIPEEEVTVEEGCDSDSDCDDGYYCADDGECAATECNDGKDNDGDDLRDMYGACKQTNSITGGATVIDYGRISSLIPYTTCSDLGASSVEDCQSACTGTYIAADTNACIDIDDNNETSCTHDCKSGYKLTDDCECRKKFSFQGVRALRAPEEEKGFFAKLLEFFIKVDVTRIIRYFE